MNNSSIDVRIPSWNSGYWLQMYTALKAIVTQPIICMFFRNEKFGY
jgi:hypothetical protein